MTIFGYLTAGLIKLPHDQRLEGWQILHKHLMAAAKELNAWKNKPKLFLPTDQGQQPIL